MKPNEDRDQRRTSKDLKIHLRVHLVNILPVIGPDLALLWKQMNWNNPRILVNEYINAISAASGGQVQYHITSERNAMKPFPLVDGYEYTGEELQKVIERKNTAHTPSFADYQSMLSAAVLNDVRRIDTDEVWIMGHPYAGLWEAAMGGPNAFDVNGGPISYTDGAGRRFVVMGFNYERGVGEMLESFGHRVERTLARRFHSDEYLNWFYRRTNFGIVPKPASNEWEQYLIDSGTVHREAGAPKLNPDGSDADYFWKNGIEEHHRRWLAGLHLDWWRSVVLVNEYR